MAGAGIYQGLDKLPLASICIANFDGDMKGSHASMLALARRQP